MSISKSEIEIIATKAFQLGVRYAIVGSASSFTEKEALADAAAIVCDELVKAGVPVQRKRKAIVECGQVFGHKTGLNTVRKYLPSNFTACESSGTIHGDCILIEGYDRAGWTLDAYVIPRLASGLIVAKEVKENDELPCRHLDYALTLDGGKCNDCGIELQ